jgi:hypothetical protein
MTFSNQRLHRKETKIKKVGGDEDQYCNEVVVLGRADEEAVDRLLVTKA